jgi:hypothetical protein
VEGVGEKLGVGVDVASIEQELLAVLDEEHLNACKVVFEELH